MPDKYIIDCNTVSKMIKTTNTNKASGPDNIPNWLLRDLPQVLAPSTCQIINNSIQKGLFPALWKSANIVHINKATVNKRGIYPSHLRESLANFFKVWIITLGDLKPDISENCWLSNDR